ncbi:MAG: DoxX family protein [Hyphomonadaceae bacterium]
MRDLLFPAWPARLADVALLLLRVLLGGYLIWGVWDNIVSAERMAEFETFLRSLNCPYPEYAAPLSVYAQFAIGICLMLGLLTRWAGVLLAVNFTVAVILLWPSGDPRTLYPPGVLVPIGFLFFALGAGRFALDARLTRPPPAA